MNYAIGFYVGPKVFQKEDVWFLNKKHLERTNQFYTKYGGKTIVISRFLPIIRTLAPFVAGIGKMAYPLFLRYNFLGAFIWVTVGLWAGFLFGNLPFVKDNFTLVIIGIVIVSVLPGVVEFIRHRQQANQTSPSAPTSETPTSEGI